MKPSSVLHLAVCFTFLFCSAFLSCLNNPAESVTKDSSNNEGSFDTTAAQIVIAPHDSLQIAVRDVITKYPGVKADVNDGEVLLTGEVEGLKLQYLITDINTLRPKKVTNKLKVIR